MCKTALVKLNMNQFAVLISYLFTQITSSIYYSRCVSYRFQSQILRIRLVIHYFRSGRQCRVLFIDSKSGYAFLLFLCITFRSLPTNYSVIIRLSPGLQQCTTRCYECDFCQFPISTQEFVPPLLDSGAFQLDLIGTVRIVIIIESVTFQLIDICTRISIAGQNLT